jgi:hypothetical protein
VKKLLLFLFFNCSVTFIWSQNNQRIELSGIILSENQDVEGVTVFNTSSNKGTITNNKGEFIIEVALNDRIEISALQFKPTLVIVDEAAISAKHLKIYLVEQVNQLDAVLLTSGLIGNLKVDMDNVKMIDPIQLNMGNMNMAFEYNDDKAFDNSVITNNLNSVMNKGMFYNGIDFVQIAGRLLGSIINTKPKKTSLKDSEIYLKPKDITDIYSFQDITKTFNIPQKDVPAFMAFLQSKEINQDLFKEENEIKLIEYLIEQRKLFLEQYDGQN